MMALDPMQWLQTFKGVPGNLKPYRLRQFNEASAGSGLDALANNACRVWLMGDGVYDSDARIFNQVRTNNVYTRINPDESSTHYSCNAAPLAIYGGIPIDNADLDTDGDGVSDMDEAANGTNPSDPCDVGENHMPELSNPVWGAADCDGDGVPNSYESGCSG